MKYLLLIILFSNVCFSQNIFRAEDYRLSEKKFRNNASNLSDNILNNTVTVIPNNSKTPVSNFITDILINGDTVWFATGSGLMRTIDNFSSFQSYYGLDPFGTDDIAGFNINGKVIVASTAVSQEISGESVPTGTGIKISTDYGVNWSSVSQPIDTQADSVIVYGSNSLYALPVVVP